MSAVLSPRVRVILIGLVVLGGALRIASPLRSTLSYDGGTFALEGRELALGHGFSTLAIGSDGTLQSVPDHQQAPLWPLLLSAVYRAFGYSVAATQWTGVAVSLVAIAVVWAVSRRVVGDDGALVAAAVVATWPRYVWSGAWGYSEDLALIFYTLTLGFVMLSLDRPAFALAAGVAAGAAFLVRGAAGAFFLLAAAAGVAWRLAHRGRRGVTEPWYLAGGAAFLALALAWTTRNVLTFWDGDPATLLAAAQTNAITARAARLAFEEPLRWMVSIARQLAVFLPIAGAVLVAGWPAIRRTSSGERAREETTSGLWIAVGSTVLVALLLGASLDVLERNPWFLLDHERYLTFALVPLAWLFARSAPSARETRVLAAWLGVAAAVSTAMIASGLYAGSCEAAEALARELPEGASVEFRDEYPPLLIAYLVERSPVVVPSGGDYAIVVEWDDRPSVEHGERFEGSRLMGRDAVLIRRSAD